MTKKKLLMLGIDAADIGFIKQFLSGLPTFKSLLEEGHFFSLDSTANTTSASVWPSFYTGQRPGEHGITHHIQWDPDLMQLRRLSSDWFSNQPFWSELERAGHRVCVVDVPFTFPGNVVNGTEITNWGSHDLMGRFAAQPSKMATRIRRRFGRHPMGYEIPVNKSSGEIQLLQKQILKGAKLKGSLLDWLIHQTEWDFFLGVFGECHRGGHILWPDSADADSVIPEEALLDVYRATDRELGKILDRTDLKTTNVVVFSLHGMRPNFSQEHFTRRVMDRINERFGSKLDVEDRYSEETSRGQRSLIRWLRESIPASLQYAVARAVPVGVRDWVVNREATGGVDWSQTPGIALRSDVHSFVRFNVAGRERDGLLAPDSDELARYRAWVKTGFLSLRNPDTNEPMVKDIVEDHPDLAGKRSGLMPDLIIRWANQRPARRVISEELGEMTAEPDTGRSGEHHVNGFAVLLGRDQSIDGLPPLSHNTHFAAFVRHLLAENGPFPDESL